MSQTGRNNMALLSIAIGLAGVALSAFGYLEIGLTMIFIAALLMFGDFIRNRLKRLGAETWALGSVIVWLGFVAFSLPVMDYVWGIFPDVWNVIVFVIGILLIILGYTTEYFDLNLRLINFWQKLQAQVIDALYSIRKRFLRSVWSVSAFLVTIYLIAGLMLPSLFAPLDGLVLDPIIILILLVVLLLAIEFRSVVKILLVRMGELFLIFLNGLVRRIRNLPGLVRTLFVRLKEGLVQLFHYSINFLSFLNFNTYLVGILAFAGFGIVALIRTDSMMGAIALNFLFISLAMLLYQQWDRVASSIQSVNQRAYQSSFTIRNYARRAARSSAIQCYNCGAEVARTAHECNNCHIVYNNCMVCKNFIFPVEAVMECKSCTNQGHKEHIENWLKLRSTCPICREQWN